MYSTSLITDLVHILILDFILSTTRQIMIGISGRVVDADPSSELNFQSNKAVVT